MGQDGSLGSVLGLLWYHPSTKSQVERKKLITGESGHLGFPVVFTDEFVLGSTGFSVVFG